MASPGQGKRFLPSLGPCSSPCCPGSLSAPSSPKKSREAGRPPQSPQAPSLPQAHNEGASPSPCLFPSRCGPETPGPGPAPSAEGVSLAEGKGGSHRNSNTTGHFLSQRQRLSRQAPGRGLSAEQRDGSSSPAWEHAVREQGGRSACPAPPGVRESRCQEAALCRRPTGETAPLPLWGS